MRPWRRWDVPGAGSPHGRRPQSAAPPLTTHTASAALPPTLSPPSPPPPLAPPPSPSPLHTAGVVAVANALLASPSFAEAGKIFDFNLTLPLMAAQFLALMVFLDKTWFGPVGKVLDERDGLLRSQLATAKGGASGLAELQAAAEEALAAARAEAAKLVADARTAASEEQAATLKAAKEKVDKELAAALGALTAEKDSALKNLDAQVESLSSDILGRVLPAGVKL